MVEKGAPRTRWSAGVFGPFLSALDPLFPLPPEATTETSRGVSEVGPPECDLVRAGAARRRAYRQVAKIVSADFQR